MKLNFSLLLLLASLTLSCTPDQSETLSNPYEPSTDRKTATETTEEATQKCIAQCLESRQMEAQTWETIEADCKNQCQNNPNINSPNQSQ